MEGAWDAAFNLTTSYRRDSDIPRPFGDANSALQDARFLWVRILCLPVTGNLSRHGGHTFRLIF